MHLSNCCVQEDRLLGRRVFQHGGFCVLKEVPAI
jgi:hypothetical protein